MDIASTDDLVERLKRHHSNLASVVVVDAGGKETTLAVPRMRTKWARLKRLLEELDWRQVRAVDKDGHLLEQFESLDADDDDGDAAALADELPDEFDVMLRFGDRCVQMALAAQKTALAPYLKSQQIIMDSQSKLIGTLTDRLVQLESMFGRTLKMAHDTALAVSGDDNRSGDAIAGMLQLAIAAKQAEAAAAAAAKPNAPKNGAPK